jgi:hypothetical protein
MSATFMRKWVLGAAAAAAFAMLAAGCGSHATQSPPAGGTPSKTSAPGGSGSAF